MRLCWLLSLAFLCAACGACSKSSKASGPGSGSVVGPEGPAIGAKGGPAPVTVWPKNAPQQSIDGDGFIITFAAPDAPIGTEVMALVEVKPKKPYHLNHEYPTELSLKAPDGVKLSKETYENNPDKRDAKVWHDEVGVFEIGYTALAKAEGLRSIEANFLFAVCTDASCDPKTATLSIPVVTQ